MDELMRQRVPLRSAFFRLVHAPRALAVWIAVLVVGAAMLILLHGQSPDGYGRGGSLPTLPGATSLLWRVGHVATAVINAASAGDLRAIVSGEPAIPW